MEPPWFPLQGILYRLKDGLKGKVRLSADGSGHADPDVLVLMRQQQLPIFPGDYDQFRTR